MEKITSAVQKAKDDLADNKVRDGGSLASAFAIARFVISMVKGLRGFPEIIECAYVRSNAHTNSKYLATPVQLGPGKKLFMCRFAETMINTYLKQVVV